MKTSKRAKENLATTTTMTTEKPTTIMIAMMAGKKRAKIKTCTESMRTIANGKIAIWAQQPMKSKIKKSTTQVMIVILNTAVIIP